MDEFLFGEVKAAGAQDDVQANECEDPKDCGCATLSRDERRNTNEAGKQQAGPTDDAVTRQLDVV
jgi:hypothetical protein